MVWSITFWSLPIFKKLIQFLRLPSNLTQISFPYLSRAAVWSGKILSSHATSKHNYSSGLGEGARRENNMNIPSLNCPGLQSSVPLCWFSSEHLLVTDGLLTGGHPNAVFPQGHICGFFWALFSLSWRVPAWILPYLSNSGSPRCSPVFSDSYFSVLDPCKLISFLSQTAEGRWSTNPSSPPLSLAEQICRWPNTMAWGPTVLPSKMFRVSDSLPSLSPVFCLFGLAGGGGLVRRRILIILGSILPWMIGAFSGRQCWALSLACGILHPCVYISKS